MPGLRVRTPESDAELRDWRHVHNTIIPTHQLSLDDVRGRSQHHHLEVAYLDDVLVGCSTVNEDGLRFALRRGFVEIERYLLPGETVPWIDLRLA